MRQSQKQLRSLEKLLFHLGLHYWGLKKKGNNEKTDKKRLGNFQTFVVELTARVGPCATLSWRRGVGDAVLGLSLNLSSHAWVDGADDVSAHAVAVLASILSLDGVALVIVDSVLKAAGFGRARGEG